MLETLSHGKLQRNRCHSERQVSCVCLLPFSETEVVAPVAVKTEPLDVLPDDTPNAQPAKRVSCFCPHGYTSQSLGHYHCRQCGESFKYVSLVNRHEKSHKELFSPAVNRQRSVVQSKLDTPSKPDTRSRHAALAGDQNSELKEPSYSHDGVTDTFEHGTGVFKMCYFAFVSLVTRGMILLQAVTCHNLSVGLSLCFTAFEISGSNMEYRYKRYSGYCFCCDL